MKKPLPTQAELKRMFHYHASTGDLIWKYRPEKSARWNERRANQCAGHLNGEGYWYVRINGKLHSSHRLIWCWAHGYWPPEQVDHINRNPSDNRLVNLRLATQAQNLRNKDMRVDNASGHTGVRWHGEYNKWRVQIGVNSRRINVGYFNTLADAVEARKAAEIKYYGEFSACR